MAHRGVLAIWHDIEVGHEAEVLHWYNRQHHPERLAIPGFRTARRYSALDGKPGIFIVYEVADAAVLRSAAYLERVNNPTDWTRESMPHFRRNSRTVCNVVNALGGNTGGLAVTVRLCPGDGRAPALGDHLDRAMAAFMASPGSVSAERWEADDASTTIHSTERILRGDPDSTASWAVMLTASDEKPLRTALGNGFGDADLAAAGAEDIEKGLYALRYVGVSDHIMS